MAERMTVQKALQAARGSDDGLYGVILENGSMELGYYKPMDHDDQKPHEQDEIYIVQSGSGTFVCNEEETEFGPGDALFVAAGDSHRFVDFTDDFGTWVIFWGPTGGES